MFGICTSGGVFIRSVSARRGQQTINQDLGPVLHERFKQIEIIEGIDLILAWRGTQGTFQPTTYGRACRIQSIRSSASSTWSLGVFAVFMNTRYCSTRVLHGLQRSPRSISAMASAILRTMRCVARAHAKTSARMRSVFLLPTAHEKPSKRSVMTKPGWSHCGQVERQECIRATVADLIARIRGELRCACMSDLSGAEPHSAISSPTMDFKSSVVSFFSQPDGPITMTPRAGKPPRSAKPVAPSVSSATVCKSVGRSVMNVHVQTLRSLQQRGNHALLAVHAGEYSVAVVEVQFILPRIKSTPRASAARGCRRHRDHRGGLGVPSLSLLRFPAQWLTDSPPLKRSPR